MTNHQLQTVLDALILLGRAANLSHDASSVEAEAITIVKQMMQVKPVAKVQRYEAELWRGDRIRFEPDSQGDWVKFEDVCNLYTHPVPQAVPAGWVSLEDGMPSPHQMVLVARESHVTTGSYTPAFGWAWEEVDGEDEDSIATHWMALPSPPKGAV
jgi:hypothetical protein